MTEQGEAGSKLSPRCLLGSEPGCSRPASSSWPQGDGSLRSPQPERQPHGAEEGSARPPPPIAGTPSSRRLRGSRLMSREGTCRWTQERGGVSEWERGEREGEEPERGPGARAGAPTPRPTAPPPHRVYLTLWAAEINSGASILPLSTSLGQGRGGVVGRQHWGVCVPAGMGWGG